MSAENRRAGREDELRKKLKATVQRYEDVFAKPLTTSVLKEFLDDCEHHNKMTFLRDRMGLLSDQDVAYLRNVLKENVANAFSVAATNKPSEMDVEELEDVSELDDADESM